MHFDYTNSGKLWAPLEGGMGVGFCSHPPTSLHTHTHALGLLRPSLRTAWHAPSKKTDFESYDPKPPFAPLPRPVAGKSIKLLRLL